MAPIRAMVVDADASSRAELRELLAGGPTCTLDWVALSLREARSILQRVTPDLLFLAAKLPDGSGLQLASAVERRTNVVIVAAHDRFAVEAFAVGALDYLVKPLKRDCLAPLLARVLARGVSPKRIDSGATRGPVTHDSAAELVSGSRLPLRSSPPSTDDGRIVVNRRGCAEFVQLDQVVAITSLGGNYTELLLQNGGSLDMRRPMKDWEAILPEEMFIRVHRGAIVNILHLDAIARARDGALKLRVQHVARPVAVSRRRSRQVNRALARYAVESLRR